MDRGFIHIRDLRKNYGAFTALHGIDLDIAEGEVVCVIGPSGSGKSTLIRCINLLEDFEPGSDDPRRRHAGGARARRSRRCGPRSGWCSSPSTCSRT